MFSRNRLYDELAHLWPLVSPPEDYADEAQVWRDLLRRRLGPGQHQVLELGVGGGHNLSHLTADFHATAVDLSPRMLEHSRRLNPGVEHHVGDMRAVRLGRLFRAVLIHDAASYLVTEDDIRQTLATAAAHLDSGGVLVMAPDFYRETFKDNSAGYDVHVGNDGTVLTYFEYFYDPDPSDTHVEMLIVFVIRRGAELRVEEDRHTLGLFPMTTWLSLMEDAGFAAEAEAGAAGGDDGRQQYLLVGTLRSTANDLPQLRPL
ncbi:MAG: class I SAM-dependent methyltransferase [Bacillota bacterium]|nr:class I SAM-dependent methyltransferase [Bacillota bacterium]